MVIDMNKSRLKMIEQIRECLQSTADVAFSIPADESTLRAFVANVIGRFRYFRLAKGQRGVLVAYLRRLTGYSRAYLSRLLAQYGDIRSAQAAGSGQPHQLCPPIQAPGDVVLLAETDGLHDTLSGPATSALLKRAFTVFGDVRFARLSQISTLHRHNLRKEELYRKQRVA